jgi:hypothetical protein
MRFYAERPVRLARQVLADVLVLAWVWLCAEVARASYAVVLQLQAPGQRLAESGNAIRDAFTNAAQTASGIPFIGDDLARALTDGSGAGTSLAAAGEGQVEAIGMMAMGTAAAVVLVGALPVVLVWLLLRLRYARVAGSAAIIRRGDTDLLALRALTHLPVRQLLTTGQDPAAAWRFGDRATVHRLAELELRSLGLWAPPTPPD